MSYERILFNYNAERYIMQAILSTKQVCEYIGICNTTLHFKRKPTHKYFDSTFPEAVRLGARRIGFRKSDIDDWVANLGKVA